MQSIDIQELELITDFERQFKRKTGKTCKVLVISKLEQVLRRLKISEILDVVERFRLPGMPSLRMACRKRELVNLRKIFCMLAKKAGYSLATIGDELGERDHTTVLYNVRAANVHFDQEAEFRNLCYEIQEKLITLHESRLDGNPAIGINT